MPVATSALAGAVERQLDLDRRLQGLAGHRRPARAHPSHPGSPWQARHGTIWASAVTTMSVPPRALISGITRGRSARGTAALSAKP